MVLSDDEQRNWRELAAQLATERRLVALAARISAIHAGATMPVRTLRLWAVGAGAALIVIVVGGVTHHTALVTVGVDVLIATLLVVGVALMVIAIADIRRTARG